MKNPKSDLSGTPKTPNGNKSQLTEAQARDITKLRDRLVMLASNSSSLRLNRLAKDKNVDLSALNEFGVEIPNKLIEHCLSKSSAINVLPSITDKTQKIWTSIDDRLTKISRTEVARFEEKGLSDLYLGFPFLVGTPEGAEKVLQAPIFLIPVKLVKEARGKGVKTWTIAPSGDGKAVFNKTLFQALQRIYNLQISEAVFEEKAPQDLYSPEMTFISWAHQLLNSYGVVCKVDDEAHDQTIDPLTEFTVKETPDSHKGPLRICQHAVLGIFPQSSSSIQLDYDKFLADGAEGLETITKFISLASEEAVLDGEAEKDGVSKPGTDQPITETPNDDSVTVDSWNETNNFRLLPSDSSQDRVIQHLANPGNKSVVIWGPPGTGKSNTIVNIVADCLNRNKTVLVVSQKRAALDVVYQRLSSKSLGVGETGLSEMVALVHSTQDDKSDLFKKIALVANSKIDTSPRPEVDPSAEIQLITDHLLSVARAYSDEARGISLRDLYRQSKPQNLRDSIDDSPWKSISARDFDSAQLALRKSREIYSGIPNDSILQNRPTYSAVDNSIKALIDQLPSAGNTENLRAALALKLRLMKGPSEERPTIDSEIESLLAEKTRLQGFTSVFSLKYWRVNAAVRRYSKQANQTIKAYESVVHSSLGKLISSASLKPLLGGANGIADVASIEQASRLISQTFYSLKTLDTHHESLPANLRQIAEAFMSVSKNGKLLSSEIWEDIFAEHVRSHWIREVESRHVVVNEIRSGRTDQLRTRYGELLAQKHSFCAGYLLRKFKDQIRKASAANEYRTLLNEVTKTRKIPTLRSLNEKMFGNKAYRELVPVWLTSPEVVSEIFPLARDLFDVVIFDEASQCPVELGIPAIYRGKQIVIAGDEMQLPPSNQFAVQADDPDDEAEDSGISEPSILSLSKKVGGYQRFMLRWHYRSKFEELISFSNHAYYDGEMLTAPNVTPSGQGASAIFWHSVKGFWVDRANAQEVELSVKRLKELLGQSNPPTVGIITFNSTQQKAIVEAIAKAEAEDPEMSVLITKNRQLPLDERYFVKNIENVQGDERDVILFSVGYAPRENGGRVFHNFGTLGNEGGENRLNVAISRAKSRIEIISSINPNSDLDTSTSKHKGPKLLKKYLCFAYSIAQSDYAQGMTILSDVNSRMNTSAVSESLVFESPFEEQVFEELRNLGFQVRTQVGQSGFRIDLGVVDPEDPARFILGIECDGASYHSSVSARERDVYRQRFLEGRGWKIHRIWSTKWWENRQGEIDKISALLEQIKAKAA